MVTKLFRSSDQSRKVAAEATACDLLDLQAAAPEESSIHEVGCLIVGYDSYSLAKYHEPFRRLPHESRLPGAEVSADEYEPAG